MTSIYLLNQLVQFRPDECLLLSMENEQLSIRLPLSASRCLKLFIESRTMVSQEKLFDYAWGADAKTITPNNLYQNISILRKAFKKLTNDENNWIITAPRQGFRLNEEVEIEVLAVPEFPEQISTTDEPAPTSIRRFAFMPVYTGRNRRLMVGGIYFLIIALCTGALAGLDALLFPEITLSQSFVFFSKIDDCNVYINKDAIDASTHMTVFTILKPICRQNKYIYITADSILHSATLLHCTQSLEAKDVHCISHLTRDFK